MAISKANYEFNAVRMLLYVISYINPRIVTLSMQCYSDLNDPELLTSGAELLGKEVLQYVIKLFGKNI